METSISPLFYLKRPKGYQSGAVPIYLRITCNGQRSEISTGRTCLPEHWNSSSGRVKGTREEVRALNSYLEAILSKVYESHRKLLTSGAQISARTIKNEFSGKGEKPTWLIKIFEDHNRRTEALIGDEFAMGTFKRYETSLKHTQDFLRWKYSLSDIDIRKIDHTFIADYEFYLRSVRKCANNSAVKYIKNFGKIIRICIANGWLDKNPFVNYKSKVKQVDRVFLTKEEIQLIVTKEFRSERINQVKDIFLFSCFTGLAYSDVQLLSPSNLGVGIDGERWLFVNRRKTDTRANIPLLPKAKQILDKYKNHPACLQMSRLLPVMSNQKMNEYLKEIADLCGITKELTFHVARHTFATTVTLTNGVPIETVSKILGHRNLRTTQHYAKIVDKKVSEDMKVLRMKLGDTDGSSHYDKSPAVAGEEKTASRV